MEPWSSRFEDALVFACRLHARQVRKGSGVPYVSHLLAVCSLVIEAGGDEEQAIAALLHDAIEDQGGDATRQVIRRQFGERIAALVDGCSDTDVFPKPPWRQRKEAYLAHLREAPPEVRLISAADKLHNLRSVLADYHQMGDELWSRFKGGRDGTLWYFHETLAIFSEKGPQTLAAQMKRTLAELEAMMK
jgi:(p)ppGpp synthase/HD superfamily hydrolase